MRAGAGVGALQGALSVAIMLSMRGAGPFLHAYLFAAGVRARVPGLPFAVAAVIVAIAAPLARRGAAKLAPLAKTASGGSLEGGMSPPPRGASSKAALADAEANDEALVHLRRPLLAGAPS